MDLSPDFLLQNPDLVTPVAPWCVSLDNLELGILLLSLPWLAGDGLRRADLERQIARLAVELPLGPVYFQRVKRTVARLEEIGTLRGTGDRTGRLFVTTPQGFAVLLLNLHVLRSDPTVDGAEFELKRALAAMCNVVMERLLELPDEVEVPPEVEGFFGEVERLTVLGERVITDEVAEEALDVLRLIASQRVLVDGMLQAARRRLAEAESAALALRGFHLSRLREDSLMRAVAFLEDAPGGLSLIREMATGDMPRLTQRSAVLRYEHYLRYLDELGALHARELRSDPLESVRGLMARRKGERKGG
jgi:hypothetical protein